jgi:tagaturonate reductase
MKLSKQNLKKVSSQKAVLPDARIFDLPEKVLQFGTGILLRGLPDYFIDKANRAGIFNGRIVMVKSTSKGNTTAFSNQDRLYTLCERGFQNGKKIEVNIICSAISRVLDSHEQWNEVLKCARNKDLKIIISNTTEVGIQLVNEDIRIKPLVSFPGKLLAFLYERFTVFHGDRSKGFVIVPTELILENGNKLKSIVLKLAQMNSLEKDFIEWLKECNYFCNSLVDRIVTGMPANVTRTQIENELGYTDDLLTVSEVYSLWAIEGDEKIKEVLSFAKADDSVVIEPNIDIYRELKLRLLNGTHTLTCGLAFLAGFETVKQAMEDKTFSLFIEYLMRNEIAPSIPYQIGDSTKQNFISQVIDRFRNPYINHYWKNITLNYTSKIRARCIPLLINYYKIKASVPPLFTFGFAAYLYFLKAVKVNGKEYSGKCNGEDYLIEDPSAFRFYEIWKSNSVEDTVKEVLKDITIWGQDISLIPGFQKTITENLNNIINYGMKDSLEKIQSKKYFPE